MSKIMIYRKKNIPFQKTPVILIKKNKSVIGGGDDSSYVWKPSNPYLCRMKKDNEYFYPAPWYAYFKSGELVQKLNFAEMQFTDFIDGISVYEEKGIEVLPYLPKTSDNYYTGNTEELTFVANKDFDMLEHVTKLFYDEFGLVIEEEHVDYKIGSYKTGENINSVSCNLLKLKYDVYVTKKDGIYNYTGEERFAIYNKIYAKAKCTGKPEFAQVDRHSINNIISGLFSADIDPTTEATYHFGGGMLGNEGYGTYDDNHAGYALCGLPRQIVNDRFWNGEQKVNNIAVRPLCSSLVGNVGGFYAEHSYDIESSSIYSGLYNARFKTWYILREVDTWKGPITG